MKSVNKRAALLLAASVICGVGQASNFYSGAGPDSLPWPRGIVPYVFTTNVTAAEQTVYLDGMKEWELAANVQFIPRTTQSYYVTLDFDYLEGTNQYSATIPPVMTIDNLSRAQVCHETGHLLGFQHEHVRVDRDNYIIVNFTNIAGANDETTNSSGESSGNPTSLYLIDSNSTPNGPYDFESVMHYGRALFSIDPATLDVIDPQPPYAYKYYNRIGNAALSLGDRAGAAYLYGPPVVPLTNIVSSTADGGPGSLRAAIYYANDHPGTAITFDIPTNDPGFSNGVYTICVSGQLPPLVSDGTVIDATTQPGYSGSPVVAVDGSRVIPETEFFLSGLYIYSGNSTVRGLALDNFSLPGVSLLYNYAASNHIEACYVGLAPDGVTPAANAFEGINIGGGGHANIIGSTNVSGRNVISGNAGYGITVTGTNSGGNLVLGNYIGLTADGSAAASNTLSGIGIWGGSCGNVIGAADAGNVLSGNGEYGVFIGDSNTVGTVVQGNYVGTDASGEEAIPNLYGGVGVFGGANNVLIGGAGAGNLLSGNGNAGLWLDGPGVTNNVAAGNWIGVDASGTRAISNGFVGIYIVDGSSGNMIGGLAAGAGNVVSGNYSEGIFISDSGTTNNVIQGNFIGTGPGGSDSIGNGYTGVGVWAGASFNLIGGTNPAARNIISGNFENGVSMGGMGTVNNQVQGNYIGVAGDGATPLGNSYLGIYLEVGPQHNWIGGATPGAGNVISANGGDGIQFWGTDTDSNFVEGNFVGTDKTGTQARGNGGSAVSMISGPRFNTVGGTGVAARNVLSGSLGDGIYADQASNNLIEGNYIGTDITGGNAISNAGEGLIFFDGSSSNQIIGNAIAASGEDGVFLGDSGTSANVIQGNKIGVGADGVAPLGNALQGVLIDNGAAGNCIGVALDGTGAGNLIADNVDEGVIVYDTDTTGNTIRGNAIFNNGRVGINLVGGIENSYGVTANHIGGDEPGPNNLQNYPVLTAAAVYGNSTVIAGTLNSDPNGLFLIDVYRNTTADSSGHGPGEFFAGTGALQTDSSGNGSFSIPLPGGWAGQYFSATATGEATGNTSEFALDVLATNSAGVGSGEFSGPYVVNSAGFSFNLSVATNQNYTLQSTTNLSAQPPVWEDVTNFYATTPVVRIGDTNSTSQARFYRVVTP